MESMTSYGENMFHLDEDPRSKNWFLIDSPKAVAMLLVCYVAFVTKIGPAMMRDYKEFQLKKFMMFYNAFQIVYCALLVAFSLGPFLRYRPQCTVLSYADEDIIYPQISYAFFLLKIVDLLDTVIFVMRKKPSQVTFLHVFHHVYVVVLGYMQTKYLAGTQVSLLNVLNGSVHVAMYYYYLVVVITKKPLWWKKYLTVLQLIQLTTMVTCMITTILNPSCKFPKLPIFGIMLLPTLVLIGEFKSFYSRSYTSSRKGNIKNKE